MLVRATAIGCLLVVGACRDGTSADPAPTFTGRWAGEPWTGDAAASLIDVESAADTLYVFGAHPIGSFGFADQVVRIRVVAPDAGTYVLDGDAVVMTDLVGGDVVSATYAGRRPGAGTLEIIAYGGPGGVIEGRVSFEAQPTRAATPYGPSARFENGWFRATINRFSPH